MTMIRVTVGTVVVTWSPEYGFTTAGVDPEHADQVHVEEIEPRTPTVDVPFLTREEMERIVAEHTAPPRHLEAVKPGLDSSPVVCLVCNHPMHDPGDCPGVVNLGDARVPCDCATAIPG